MKQPTSVHKASVEAVTYGGHGNAVLTCTLPGNWEQVIEDRLKHRFLDEPESYKAALKQRGKRTRPTHDDLTYSFGKVVNPGEAIRPERIEYEKWLHDMPHQNLLGIHELFGKLPRKIDFEKIKTNEQLAAQYKHLEREGVQILRAYPPAEGINMADPSPHDFRLVRARAVFGDYGQEAILEMIYAKGNGGKHELKSMEFFNGTMKGVAYTPQHYELFESARNRAIADITTKRKGVGLKHLFTWLKFPKARTNRA